MRLIDADAYKKYLDENWIVANYDAIDAQPTIDAFEVVRCKDCVNFSASNSFTGKCTLRGDYIFTTDFCSYAVERRTDERPD